MKVKKIFLQIGTILSLLLVTYLFSFYILSSKANYEGIFFPFTGGSIEKTGKDLKANKKDFSVKNGKWTAQSNDPWINFSFNGQRSVSHIEINISNLRIKGTDCYIFYSNGKSVNETKYVVNKLLQGKNIFHFKSDPTA